MEKVSFVRWCVREVMKLMRDRVRKESTQLIWQLICASSFKSRRKKVRVKVVKVTAKRHSCPWHSSSTYDYCTTEDKTHAQNCTTFLQVFFLPFAKERVDGLRMPWSMKEASGNSKWHDDQQVCVCVSKKDERQNVCTLASSSKGTVHH